MYTHTTQCIAFEYQINQLDFLWISSLYYIPLNMVYTLHGLSCIEFPVPYIQYHCPIFFRFSDPLYESYSCNIFLLYIQYTRISIVDKVSGELVCFSYIFLNLKYIIIICQRSPISKLWL